MRVLVVDDTWASTRILQRIIQTYWQHEVRVAHDGHSACAAAQTFQPQVILLDIGLPGLDGYEVVRRLRSQPGFDRTFIVAVTGYGNPADRDRSRNAGFDLHLVKPISVEQLAEVFRVAGQRQTIRDAPPISRETKAGNH